MAEADIANFRKALTELETYCAMPVATNRDRAGIIQAFEFTFEQAWKSIQKVAGRMGTQVAFPKQALVQALAAGYINATDEPLWLQLLQDRNLTSHTYKQALAVEVLSRIQADYLRMFRGLLGALEAVP